MTDVKKPAPAELADLCGRLAEEKLAEHVLKIHVGPQSSVADWFVIATANSEPQLRALANFIERQLRKNKSRLEKRLRKEAFDAGPDEAYFVPENDEDEEPAYQLVRTKRFFFRPMSIDEAILQMNLVGHTFFAFRNEDDGGAFSVVYKRNDGGYGIIVDQD